MRPTINLISPSLFDTCFLLKEHLSHRSVREVEDQIAFLITIYNYSLRLRHEHGN